MVGARMDALRHGRSKSMAVCLLVLLSVFCPSLPLGLGQILPIVGRNTTTSQLQTYVVHVRKPQHMMSASPGELKSWHRSFLPSPFLDSGEPRMVYSYQRAISGFAAKLTPDEVEAMAAKEGFLFAHPDEHLVFETSWTWSFLSLTAGLWSRTDFAKGVVVAVIDSGINPGHSSFADDNIPAAPTTWSGSCHLRPPNKCNKKLIGAMNFDSDGPRVEPVDNTGHGTFVASVVGGNIVVNVDVHGLAAGNAAGTSLGVHLAVYRADQTSGLIASFDEAIRVGVDLITVSMTLPNRRFYQNDLAIAALSAVESGIVVSCAAGNGGPHRSSVRNDAPWILTVGASTMDRAFRVSLVLGSGEKCLGESLERPGQIPTQQLGLVYPGANNNMLKTCSSPLNGVAGMAVLCESDPAISPKEQGENVKNARGAAMILMNSLRNGSTLVLEENVLPTVAITYEDSLLIVNYAQSTGGRSTVAMKAEGTIYAVNPNPVVASFSGRGPSTANGGILKPDVIGPGVNIIGASSKSSNGFVMMSGTSVSTAHLASVSALLKKSHKTTWSPAAIRSAIMTSSNYLDNGRVPIMDETGGAAGAFAVGAGHVHPGRADDPGLVYDIEPEDYIRYLCGLQGYSPSDVDAVARRGVNCAAMGMLKAEELNYPSISVKLSTMGKTVTRTVRNEGIGHSTYRAEVVGMPQEVAVLVNPNVLHFTSKGDEKSFTVSFSLAQRPPAGAVYEGQLKWVATTSLHVVRSPLVVTVE